MRHLTPHLLRPSLLSWLLACATGLYAATYEGAPAEIVSGDKTIANAYVFEETLEGVSFAIEDPRGPATKKPRKQYDRITYGDPKDGNFKIAEILFDKNDSEKALAAYRKAIDSATYQWVAEKSQLRCAELFLRLGKPDEGIAILDDFATKRPNSARMAEVVALRADLRLAKGDLAGADKDFSDLITNQEAWKAPAGRGVLGRAEIMRRSKKFADAVQLIQPAFAAIQPATDAEAWATLGLTLADLQSAAAQKEPALATARQLAFTNATPARLRFAAHLRIAKLLADGAAGKVLTDAFDHAALAIGEDADEATMKAARALASDLVARINKDPAFAEPERKEYRDYARKL